MIFRKHFFLSLLGIIVMDKSQVFMTSFEYLVFFFVYVIHSMTLASDEVIQEYNKKVMPKLIIIGWFIDNWDSGILLVKLASKKKWVVPEKDSEHQTIPHRLTGRGSKLHTVLSLAIYASWISPCHPLILPSKLNPRLPTLNHIGCDQHLEAVTVTLQLLAPSEALTLLAS